MILIDTGPLVALIDQKSKELHDRTVVLIQSLSHPLLTTWPCLTEALYLSGQLLGWAGQESLRTYLIRGAIRVHQPEPNEWERALALMEQYNDTPMDFADASLVSLAELRGVRRIITIDSDFYIYRINGAENFDVIQL
jgi:uncharacterized protein